MKELFFLMLAATLIIPLFGQTKYPDINKQMQKGNFTKASQMIKQIIEKGDIPENEKYNLQFQIDKMHRIRLDFNDDG